MEWELSGILFYLFLEFYSSQFLFLMFQPLHTCSCIPFGGLWTPPIRLQTSLTHFPVVKEMQSTNEWDEFINCGIKRKHNKSGNDRLRKKQEVSYTAFCFYRKKNQFKQGTIQLTGHKNYQFPESRLGIFLMHLPGANCTFWNGLREVCHECFSNPKIK